MTNTVQTGQTVRVHYKGTLDDGSEFDNSRARGEMMEVEVGTGQLIRGFDNALLGMRVGEIKKVVVGPKEAYGWPDSKAIMETKKTSFPKGFEFRVGEVISGANDKGALIFQTQNGSGGFGTRLRIDAAGSMNIGTSFSIVGKHLSFEIELIDIQD